MVGNAFSALCCSCGQVDPCPVQVAFTEYRQKTGRLTTNRYDRVLEMLSINLNEWMAVHAEKNLPPVRGQVASAESADQSPSGPQSFFRKSSISLSVLVWCSWYHGIECGMFGISSNLAGTLPFTLS